MRFVILFLITPMIVFVGEKNEGIYVKENSPYIQLIDSLTDTISVVYPDSSSSDDHIRYYIKDNYSEDSHGIIPAKLLVTADNMKPDTIDIDLNPLDNDISPNCPLEQILCEGSS